MAKETNLKTGRNGLTQIPKKPMDRNQWRELLEAASELFCSGVAPKEIKEHLMKRHLGEDISRDAPYRLLQSAAKKGILTCTSKKALDIAESLRDQLGFGKSREPNEEVAVAPTILYPDVAKRTSDLIFDLLAKLAKEKRNATKRRTVVRMGWAGGHLMRLVAQYLAERIKRPEKTLPDEIVCQTVVGAWDVESPMLHPNAFFSYFDDEEFRQSDSTRFAFVALYAPVLVNAEMQRLLDKDENFKSARENAQELDIIVTSVGLRKDHENMLHKFYEHVGPSGTKLLDNSGCIGDFLALPFGADGPIKSQEFKQRPLTLLNAEEVRSMVERGTTKVILAAGPCLKCKEQSGPVLRTDVIEQVLQSKLVTHLVVDLQTAMDLSERVEAHRADRYSRNR